MKIELDLPVPEGWRCIGFNYPEKGQGYICHYHDNSWKIASCECSNIYLTFERIEQVDEELDEELEAVKVKYIGKWVQSNNTTICKITDAYRGMEESAGEIVFMSGYESIVGDLTIVTLPVWRCCESDKPKASGKRAVRRKGEIGAIKIDHYYATIEGWEKMSDDDESKNEWLDEGEL